MNKIVPGPNDVTQVDVDDRLMHQSKFATLESAIKGCFYGKPLSHAFKHRLVEYRNTIAPRVFGAVHRRVGMAKQVVGRCGDLRVVGGYPDTCGDKHVALAQGEWLIETFKNSIGQQHGVGLILGESVEHNKLVARNSSNDASGWKSVSEALRDRDKHIVSSLMAE
jgi:hypothetical protein